MTVQTWLVDISREKCQELLTACSLGRLAVVVDGRPEIFPVSYVIDSESGSIVFPSNAGTKLHAALTWPYVAFEIDGIETDNTGGWSVSIVGHACEVTDRTAIARFAQLRTALWRSGPAVHWIRIDATTTSGRRISAAA